MKILVAFYSRTGNTKKLGKQIAGLLKADVDEIIDKKDRNGIKGWLGAGKDVLFKKPTKIKHEKNPEKYDLVIVGTPVWAGTMTPAVKEYLFKNSFNKIAFFCTFGGNASRTFDDMEKMSESPISKIGLKDKKIDNSEKEIVEFCKKLKK